MTTPQNTLICGSLTWIISEKGATPRTYYPRTKDSKSSAPLQGSLKRRCNLSKYTVLLLRPDYIADEFGKDTYCAHVKAQDSHQAIGEARHEACNVDRQHVDVDELEDYHVLFCCEGWVFDCSLGSPQATPEPIPLFVKALHKCVELGYTVPRGYFHREYLLMENPNSVTLARIYEDGRLRIQNNISGAYHKYELQ